MKPLLPEEQLILLSRVLSGVVKGRRVAIDGGAHFGDWCEVMAREFDTVHAFEPDPDTFAVLSRRMSGKQNVTLHMQALFDCEQPMELRWPSKREGNTRSRRVAPARKGTTQGVDIDGLKLDACDLIKVDLEGCEYHALKGARQTIERFKPVLIVEFDKYGKFVGVSEDDLSKLIAAYGYREIMTSRPDKVFVPC